jgi:hypothetical protein
MNKILGIFLGSLLLLTGCSASARFDAVQSDVSLTINEEPEFAIVEAPYHTYSTTSFGQYKFKAEKEGVEAMYGLIPLKFNGGYLAADILFFAPAMFFNLREVFPYYQFDLEKNEVRYKKTESDEWTIYKPKTKEIERAKRYFGD